MLPGAARHERLQRDFADVLAARALLVAAQESEKPISSRLSLALLELAKGDLEKLRGACELARSDWRDVYFNAWYLEPEGESSCGASP